MSNAFKGTAVVIPTRNRAALTIQAILSVLEQPASQVEVLVSDNSTSEQELAVLSEFCARADDSRLRYVTPPQPMPMTEHWGWALQEALRLCAASHVTYLTDRMLFKPGALEELAGIASLHPDAVTSYMHDMVVDDKVPVRVYQHEWSGELLRIQSSRLLYLASQSIRHEALPRMLNCHVPRAVFAELEKRFGNVFASTAPDFCFCYRVLEMAPAVLFYDKALLVHYALSRSNGASIVRGEVSSDHADFLANLGPMPLNYAAPIPEISTVSNAITHEYCVVRNETKSSKLPAVDLPKYMDRLALDLEEFVDPQRKVEMRELLISHGWDGPLRDDFANRDVPLLKKLISPKKVGRRLAWELRTMPARVSGLLGGEANSSDAGNGRSPLARAPQFETAELALEYVVRSPPPRTEYLPRLEALEVEALPEVSHRPTDTMSDASLISSAQSWHGKVADVT